LEYSLFQNRDYYNWYGKLVSRKGCKTDEKAENVYIALLMGLRQEKKEEAVRNTPEKQAKVPTIIPPIPKDTFEKLNKLGRLRDK
jgi:hypothetical protein